ncbi:putative quinate permease [Rhizoctonia solani]|uniref:Putative quinate permease n=1 Tax=Rhizoctonia solani TaxID=456999 RepID=A0A0K6G7G8_9AGAM|nr:putative quinate permease [Rhizoctonia solani]
MAFGQLAHYFSKERWQRIKDNRRLVYCTVVINMGALLLGYDSGIAGAVIPLRAFKHDMQIDGTRVAVATVNSNVVSVLFGGAFFGSIITSFLSYYLGRRAALLYSMALFALGGALQTAAKNLQWMYAGRFVSGLAVGATSLISPYYIAEISPTKHRARTVGAFQAFLVAGSLLAYWVTYGCDLQYHPTLVKGNPPTGTNTTGTIDPGAPADPAAASHLEFRSAGWRIPMGLQLLPGVLFSILMIGVSESPRWLASKGRKEDAIRTLAWLRCVDMTRPEAKDSDSQVEREKEKSEEPQSAITTLSKNTDVERRPAALRSPEIAAIHEEYAGIQAQLDETRGASYRELVSRVNLRRVMVSTYVAVFHIWIFHTGILYYAPTVFKNIGFSDTRSALLASGVFGAVKFVSTVLALTFTINRWGRVTGMAVGTGIQGILFFILGAIMKTKPPHGGPIQPASIAMMAIIYLYVIVYSFGMGPLPWVYSSEIYPLRIRELGQMWFTALTWACNFATSRVTPILFVKLGWKTWMLFASLNLGGAIICWFICPETKGLSMEELDILFGAISAEQRAADIEKVLQGHADGSRLNVPLDGR